MFYKDVRRLKDGQRVSQFIEGDWCQRLNYRPNGITRAPKGSWGIYCYDDLYKAKKLVDGNTYEEFTGVVEVHIAHPIGEGELVCWGMTFPAIRLGRTVAKFKVYRGYRQGRDREQ